MAEGKEHPLAVGISKMSRDEMYVSYKAEATPSMY